MNDLTDNKASGKALLPLIIFILTYLATGIILTSQNVEMAFYAVNPPIFVLIGIISAFLIFFKNVFSDNLNDFLTGCADNNIIIMCMIYLLAGAFSALTKSTGAVDSVVNLSLSIIAVQFITAGIFVIFFFISTAMGSSVGTVVALGTIAIGIAEKGNLNTALVGGAMAGDNISIISDTTIAATRIQNVNMKDKFSMNFKNALPAALLTVVFY